MGKEATIVAFRRVEYRSQGGRNGRAVFCRCERPKGEIKTHYQNPDCSMEACQDKREKKKRVITVEGEKNTIPHTVKAYIRRQKGGAVALAHGSRGRWEGGGYA